MSKYVDEIIEKVVRENPGETEFHNTVKEVLTSIAPVIDANPKYQNAALLERMVEPERVVMFRVPWVDDAGKVHVNKGSYFRVAAFFMCFCNKNHQPKLTGDIYFNMVSIFFCHMYCADWEWNVDSFFSVSCGNGFYKHVLHKSASCEVTAMKPYFKVYTAVSKFCKEKSRFYSHFWVAFISYIIGNLQRNTFHLIQVTFIAYTNGDYNGNICNRHVVI